MSGISLGTVHASIGLDIKDFTAGIATTVQSLTRLEVTANKLGSNIDKSIGTSLNNIDKSYQLWQLNNDKMTQALTGKSVAIETTKSKLNLLDTELKNSDSTLQKLNSQFNKNTEELKKYEKHLAELKERQAAFSRILDEDGLKDFEKQINLTQTSINKLTKEIDSNAKELTEYQGHVADLKIHQAELNSQLDNMTSVSGKLKSSGEALKDIGQDLTTKVTLPLLGVGAASVKVATDFEQGISNIKAQGGEAKTRISELKDLAMEAGAKTVYSAKESATAIEELIKAGVSVEDILNGGLTGALSLASAGELELADAAEIASTALNSFKEDGLTVAQAGDILAGAANASATSVGELKYGLSACSAVASSVGLSFKDTATSLAVFAQNGLRGSDAGTSLKTMLMNLQPSTDKQYEAFERLGLMTYDVEKGYNYLINQGIKPTSKSFEAVDHALKQHAAHMVGAKEGSKKAQDAYEELLNTLSVSQSAFFDANGSLKSMDEIAGILQTSMNNLTDAQRLQIMETMFGSDAIRAANILYKEGADGINKMKSEMSKTTAEEVAKEKLNNFNGALEEMKGSLETAGIVIGEKLIPFLRGMAEGITNATNVFLKLPEPIQDTIIGIGVLAATIGPLLFATGTLAVSLGNLIELGKLLSPTVVSLAGNFVIAEGGMAGFIATTAAASGPILVAVAALTGIAIAGHEIYKSLNEKATPSIKTFEEATKQSKNSFSDMENKVTASAATIDNGLSNISKSTAKAIDSYIKLDNDASKSLMSLNLKNSEITKQISDDLTSKFKNMGQQVKTNLDHSYNESVNSLKTLFTNSKSISTQEQEAILKNLKDKNEEKKKAYDSYSKQVTDILTRASNEHRQLTVKEQSELRAIRELMLEGAVKSLSNNQREQKVILEKIKNDSVTISTEQASEIIKNSIQTKEKVIKEANEQYDKTVATIIKQRDELKSISTDQANKLIKDAQKQKDDTIFNATQMHEQTLSLAKQNYSKQVEMIDTTTGKIKTKWQKMKEDTVEVLDDMGYGLEKSMKSLDKNLNSSWEYIKTGAIRSWNSIKSEISNKVDETKTTVVERFNELKTSATKKIEELKTNITTTFSSLPKNMVSIGKDIMQGLVNGITNGAQAVYTKAKNIADNISNTIKNALDIHSPSRVTTYYGEMVSEGLAEGMEKKKRDVSKTSKDLTKIISDELKSTKDLTNKSTKETASIIANALNSTEGVTKKSTKTINKIVADALGNTKEFTKQETNEIVKLVSDSLDKTTTKTKKSSVDLAQVVNDALSKVNTYVTNTTGIVEKKFELWTLQNKKLEGSSQYLSKQLEVQKEKHKGLTDEIEVTQKAVDQLTPRYGANSIQVLELQNKLLDLQIAQQKVNNEMEETKKKVDAATDAWRSYYKEVARGVYDVSSPSSGGSGGGGSSYYNENSGEYHIYDGDGNHTVVDKDGNMRDATNDKYEISDSDRENGVHEGSDGHVYDRDGFQVYHEGGWVSKLGNMFDDLRNDEVPAILQEGEFVLSRQMIESANTSNKNSTTSIIDYDRLGQVLAKYIKPNFTMNNTYNSPDTLTPSKIKNEQEVLLRNMGLAW